MNLSPTWDPACSCIEIVLNDLSMMKRYKVELAGIGLREALWVLVGVYGLVEYVDECQDLGRENA